MIAAWRRGFLRSDFFPGRIRPPVAYRRVPWQKRRRVNRGGAVSAWGERDGFSGQNRILLWRFRAILTTIEWNHHGASKGKVLVGNFCF